MVTKEGMRMSRVERRRMGARAAHTHTPSPCAFYSRSYADLYLVCTSQLALAPGFGGLWTVLGVGSHR